LANYVRFGGELRPMFAMFGRMLEKWLSSSVIIFQKLEKSKFFWFFSDSY